MRRVRSRGGIAAIEFAFVGGIMSFLIVNAFDVTVYFYTAMQVANAAEMGAQAAFQACDPTQLPATTRCAGLNAAVRAAVSSTTLGAAITLAGGYPREGYYCLSSAGTLQYMADVDHRPDDCTDAGAPGVAPADYVQIQVSYSYSPILPISVAALFTTPIVRSATMRLL